MNRAPLEMIGAGPVGLVAACQLARLGVGNSRWWPRAGRMRRCSTPTRTSATSLAPPSSATRRFSRKSAGSEGAGGVPQQSVLTDDNGAAAAPTVTAVSPGTVPIAAHAGAVTTAGTLTVDD